MYRPRYSVTVELILGLSYLLFGINKENSTEVLLDLGHYLHVLHVIDRQWMLLVITLDGCSRRTQWSSLLDWCKDLDWDILELLLVWVDKENSIEFPFNCGTLLIHLLCLLLFINSHASLFSCFISYVHWFPS